MLAGRMMTKQEYKNCDHFLRTSAFIIHSSINWDQLDHVIAVSMLYGYSEINTDELLS